jgi:methylthioribose-1-phosphate isomerase
MCQVLGAFGTIWAPKDSPTYNPAFDVTPIDLVESIILDSGIYTREQIVQGAFKVLKEEQQKTTKTNDKLNKRNIGKLSQN